MKEAEGLQDALAKLGPDVVAIYTLVTPDKYVALLVTPGARKAYTASIKEADLNAKIFEFRHQLQDRNSDPRPLAQQLYGIVFPEGLRHDLDANAREDHHVVDRQHSAVYTICRALRRPRLPRSELSPVAPYPGEHSLSHRRTAPAVDRHWLWRLRERAAAPLRARRTARHLS